MVGIDVGRYLEDETSELLFFRFHHAFLSLCRTRRRGNFNKAIQQFLHTEVIQRRAEEDGSHLSRAIGVDLEFRIDAVDQLQVVAQLLGIAFANLLIECCAADVDLYFLGDSLLVGSEQVELLFVDVVDALELCTLIDGP